MSNAQELADIREEWAFVQNSSSLGYQIPVHGGWLVGAMTQMFDYINDLEVAAKARHEESTDLREEVATLEATVTDLEKELGTDQ
jgi:hypothetical protein